MPSGPANLDYDPEDDVYRLPDAHAVPGAISTAIVTAVAAIHDTPVADLECLTDRVDPDALDRLFAPTRDGSPRLDGELRFEFAGCTVVVESEGEIRIYPGEDAGGEVASEVDSEPESGWKAEDA
jgi:hypothetical protein